MTAEPVIRLERLTKRYEGQTSPAVDDVSLDIPPGETVVLVGPSGCGKTTTLKMINRLVEPTSGRVLLEGRDVTGVNPNELRRRIGYVIQQIGLFPHLDVARNIGLVPRVLGWDRSRIGRRVDELLELVGLDPAAYRARYPKELSGGQRQRVGVARALAADPPVLLMDEPFGAIDPVTRARLQDELLWLQSRLHKTIVFVTHDIDEAVKMGDRIAVFSPDARVAQYDTPDRLLAHPADSFVSGFIGRGASLKRLTLRTIRDARLAGWTVAVPTDDPSAVLADLRRSGRATALLLDGARRPQRWVTASELEGAGTEVGAPSGHASLSGAGRPADALVGPDTTLQEALDVLLSSSSQLVVAVDEEGLYRGVLDVGALAATMREEVAVRPRVTGSEPAEGEP